MRARRSASAASKPMPAKSGDARTLVRMFASTTSASSQIDSTNTTAAPRCEHFSTTCRRRARVELVASKIAIAWLLGDEADVPPPPKGTTVRWCFPASQSRAESRTSMAIASRCAFAAALDESKKLASEFADLVSSRTPGFCTSSSGGVVSSIPGVCCEGVPLSLVLFPGCGGGGFFFLGAKAWALSFDEEEPLRRRCAPTLKTRTR
mmetsp:Transcript_6344/g.26673  ORF Transcript_6344/g.26673 Transcript_6344/m.26673 type:complete len:207 (+) Transcript_6344:1433-2053(+)